MYYITRKEHFSASHKLENKNFSKKKNTDIFGKCNTLHGHNYYIKVTVCGKVNLTSGYTIDLKEIKKIIFKEIINKVDHKFLNELPMFKNIIPTTENMAYIFWNILKRKIDRNNLKLYSVKIYETEKNSVTYKGEI